MVEEAASCERGELRRPSTDSRTSAAELSEWRQILG